VEQSVTASVVIEPGWDGWFVGHFVEYPGVLTQGRTVAETELNLKDALKLYLETEEE
jgi:predicted RNase H-like HicB family nuclease